MCKVKKYHGTSNTRIDECMVKVVNLIDTCSRFKVIACCCGHGKYNQSIILKTINGNAFDLVSNTIIPRKRNIYKRDKQGYYYIPEVVNTNNPTNKNKGEK